MNKLKGKVVVVTGTSSGIGNSTAQMLQQQGCIVCGLTRNAQREFELACDVSDRNRVQMCVEEIVARYGHIDCVVNNVGIGISGAIEYESEENIKKMLDVNLAGTINVIQCTLPYVKKTQGRYINIGSVAGELTIAFQTMYSVAKAGILALSEGLAMELKPFGVKVCCLQFGDIKTPFTAHRNKSFEGDDTQYNGRIARSVSRMERDETNGYSVEFASGQVVKLLKKIKLPVKYTAGAKYKFLLWLSRVLPYSLVQKILYSMYAS